MSSEILKLCMQKYNQFEYLTCDGLEWRNKIYVTEPGYWIKTDVKFLNNQVHIILT